MFVQKMFGGAGSDCTAWTVFGLQYSSQNENPKILSMRTGLPSGMELGIHVHYLLQHVFSFFAAVGKDFFSRLFRDLVTNVRK